MSESKKSLKAKVVSGLIWKFGERIGARLISFIVSIVLARMLAPEDFGLVSLMLVFVALADTFVASGLGNALVQKKNADELDFSSVFYLCTVFSIVLYAVLFFSAPALAVFYKNPRLAVLLRVIGLRVLFFNVNTVQNAYVDRHLMFKRYFYSTISGTVLSAVVALGMAYAGFGVWALVAQNLVQTFAGTLVLWFTVRWRPILAFSWERMKALYSFGWKILVSSLITELYNHLRSLIIGRLYTATDLAYFTRGKSFPTLISDNITFSINSVMFPAIAKAQSDPQRVKNMTRRSIKTTSYIIMPMMIGMAAVAEPLVRFLLTDKWLACVPYLQITCITSALLPIQGANIQAIKAMGRSDIILRLDVVKRAFGVLILLPVMHHSVLAIALSNIVASAFFLVMNLSPNRKLFDYSFGEQMRDIIPYLAISLLMGAAVYPIKFLGWPLIVILFAQGLAGAGIYILVSVVFRLDSLFFVKNIIMEMLAGTRKN